MALVKCKECDQKISKKAKTCPNCGTPRKNGVGAIPSLIIITLFVWFLVSSHKNESALGTLAQAQNNAVHTWQYRNYPDEMGRGEVKQAVLLSQNEVDFRFPYGGPQRATLTLRKHPKYGNDVILSLNKAQFLCGLDGCNVNVKFGNNKAETFPVVEPADHSSNTLFIRNYDSFLANLKKSSVIKIEAQFYQDATRVFEFNTAGLTWQ